MDRIEAMRIFVAALNEGSLAGAGRLLGRSAATVTRSIDFLETQVGVRLLTRTTRSIRLTEAGERYASACRRILVDLEEAELQAAGDRNAPRGTLSLTAPVVSGRHILRPILHAFLESQPATSARLLLLDRPVNLVEEGFDAALRIAHLPDSNLIAIRTGSVRRVVCASPAYLAGRSPISKPSDLCNHECIGLIRPGSDVWSFPQASDGKAPQNVRIVPRLSVSDVDAAVASAAEGHGIVRLLSYHAAREIQDGRLVVLLRDDEPSPLPVHLITPETRLSAAKVRAFIDFAVPLLKSKFADIERTFDRA